MRNKTLTVISLSLLMAGICSCGGYDDSLQQEKLDALEDRFAKIEQECATVNSQIAAFQTVIDAVRKNWFVTLLEQTAKGYDVYFSNGQRVSFDSGVSEDAPVIGVKKGDDGIYWWTINGELLRDSEGNMVAADSEAVISGAAISVTPLVKAEDGVWYISYDNGTTWDALGSVEGTAVDSLFSGVSQTETEVVFHLQDGSIITLPKYMERSISLSSGDEITCTTGVPVEVEFSVNGATVADLAALPSSGLNVRISSYNEHSGKLLITAQEGFTSGTITIVAECESNEAIIKILKVKI